MPAAVLHEDQRDVGVGLRLQRVSVWRRRLDRDELGQAKVGYAAAVGIGEAAHEAQAEYVAQLGPVAHEIGDGLQQVARRTIAEEPAREGEGAVIGIGTTFDGAELLEVDPVGDDSKRQIRP